MAGAGVTTHEVTMKKTILSIAALVFLSAATMMAQPRAFGVSGSGGSPDGTQTTDPATLAAREVTFLTHLLTLSADQQTQATTIFTALGINANPSGTPGMFPGGKVIGDLL